MQLLKQSKMHELMITGFMLYHFEHNRFAHGSVSLAVKHFSNASPKDDVGFLTFAFWHVRSIFYGSFHSFTKVSYVCLTGVTIEC